MDHHYHDGQMLLLRLHASRQSISPMGRAVYAMAHEKAVSRGVRKHLTRNALTNRFIQIIKCLTRHKMPLDIAGNGMDVLGTNDLPQELAGINFRTAQVCAKAQVFFDNGNRVDLVNVIEDAIALDMQFQIWIDECFKSEGWAYQTFLVAPDETIPADGVVEVHRDLWTAHIWNSCRSKRAHLHEVLLHCLSLLDCYPGAKNQSSKLRSLGLDEDLFENSRHVIDDMVSGICSSVPFLFGDVDSSGKIPREKRRMPLAGKQLVWPLHVARASVEGGSETEIWIKGRLNFIDSTLGIRFGRLVADKARKEPWILS
jgi:hypothetical protein